MLNEYNEENVINYINTLNNRKWTGVYNRINPKNKIDCKDMQYKKLLIDEYPFEELSIVRDDRINKEFEKIDTNYIFIGHEHKSFEMELNNKKLFDVGSSGCRKDDETFYTIITIKNDTVNIEKKHLIYERGKFISTTKFIEYPNRKIISKIFFGLNDL